MSGNVIQPLTLDDPLTSQRSAALRGGGFLTPLGSVTAETEESESTCEMNCSYHSLGSCNPAWINLDNKAFLSEETDGNMSHYS